MLEKVLNVRYLALDVGNTQKVYRGLIVACIRNNFSRYLIKEGGIEMGWKGLGGFYYRTIMPLSFGANRVP
jgi:hypothetical protein